GQENTVLGSWFQPGGGLLATTWWYGTTRLWDPIRGRLLASFSGYCQGWQRDGSRLMIHSGPEMTTYRLTGGFGRRTIDVPARGRPCAGDRLGPRRGRVRPGRRADRAGLGARRRGAGRGVGRPGPGPPADRPLRRGGVPARRRASDQQQAGRLPLADPARLR